MGLDFEAVASRGATLLKICSHAGLHAFQGIRAAHHVTGVYEQLVASHGADKITEEMFKEALAADPSTHPFLDALMQYLPQILAILAMFIKAPVPAAK